MKALTDKRGEALAKFVHDFASARGPDGEKLSGVIRRWSTASTGRRETFRELVRQLAAKMP